MTRSQVRRIATATVLALLALTATTALGAWQYTRAHRDDIARAVYAAAPIDVASAVRRGEYVPEQYFTQQVRMQGTLRLDRALRTCGRTQDRKAGCWLIAPLQTSATSAVTVVLGFVPADEHALRQLRAQGATAFSGVGRLQPGEIIDRGHAILEPTTTVHDIAVNELAMRWRLQLLDGYVVLEHAFVGEPVRSALVTPPSGITWRNLLYAWQWWAFAVFVAFLLIRYIIDVRNEGRSIAAERKDS